MNEKQAPPPYEAQHTFPEHEQSKTRTRRNLLERIFPHFEINGGAGRCPTYLHRWTLLTGPRGFAVYLHKFVGSDWGRDPHDHPKRFISIGLKGSYVEQSYEGIREANRDGRLHSDEDGVVRRRYNAPWIRSFPAEHVHRLLLDPGTTCWTIVITLPISRAWGFWPPTEQGRRSWKGWREYINSAAADQAKDC